MGVDVSSYSVGYRQNRKSIVLGDGSLKEAVVFWSPYRSQKYEAQVGFQYLTMANLTSLAVLKETGLPFLWYPESVSQPSNIFLVNWTNPLTWKYDGLYKTAGIDVSLDLKEV